jgi:uncharacterized repeat protein (TIGR03943 family)
MRRETQNILLVLLGGALLKISLGDSYLRYVKPAHQPWLIAAGVVMVALAAISIVREVLAARSGPVADGELAAVGDAHGHHHNSLSTWLLVLPVLAVFLIAPPSLGSDSVTRSAGRAAPPVSANDAMFPPLAAGSVVSMRMSDFASRSAWDSSRSLEGRTVKLVGFVVQQQGATYLARMAIACCAADAFPVKVRMTGDEVTTLANDTWVEVEAVLRPGSATRDNQYVPTVAVSGVRRVPEPTDPYEY